jgi:hypothetical protein
MGLHASITEIVWTLFAAAGGFFSLRGMISALQDRHAVSELDPDRGLCLLANGRLREQIATLFVMLDFAGIGIWAMTQPDPPHVTTGELLLTIVFIGAVIVLAANAAADDRERAELRRYVRAGDA